MVILEVHREYQGKLQRAGEFIEERGEEIYFSYSDEYLNRPDSASLSISLPMKKKLYPRESYQGFFEGLVPEGRVRTELAHRFRISPSDYLGMLQHLEDESIGALVFLSPKEVTKRPIEPSYHLIDEETLVRLTEFPVETAAELTEKGRFSLAGAQTKIGVYLEDDKSIEPRNADYRRLAKCYLPEGSAASTHILKIPERRFKNLPANEVFCLSVAKSCGIDACESSICLIGDAKVFITKRYDRVIEDDSGCIDGLPRPIRLHQEDFCQALGLPNYRKYEIENTDNYVAIIASLIERASGDVIEDKVAFARQTIFNYLIGNCDNHIKNYSLLYSSDWSMQRLAPAYDIVCTTILGYSREMGISIGDTRTIDDVSSADWLLFSQDLRIPEKSIAKLMADVAMRFETATASTSLHAVPEDDSSVAEEIIADANPRLAKLKQAASFLS